jgi:hypothetical protein
MRGVSLPPIELVRGPDGYYVRDGHHRPSVVHALVHNQATSSGMVEATLAVAQGRRKADRYHSIPPISSAYALGQDYVEAVVMA